MLEPQINRAYVRTSNWSISAKTSKDIDGERWVNVQVQDLAAGGLLFLTESSHELGEALWFDLLIDPLTPGVNGKIPMKIKGEIRGERGGKDGMHAFSVAFTEIAHSDRIRLDELVRMTTYKYKVDSGLDIFDR